MFCQEAETKKTNAALKLTATEEQAYEVLTPWEMDLEMLEDYINNPEPVGDYHEQMLVEENYEESLRDFIQGVERMMNTVVPRYAAEDERKFHSEEQLGEVGHKPTQRGMAVVALSK
jgi:hypothetical protein